MTFYRNFWTGQLALHLPELHYWLLGWGSEAGRVGAEGGAVQGAKTLRLRLCGAVERRHRSSGVRHRVRVAWKCCEAL
jgi:hypothetical protein